MEVKQGFVVIQEMRSGIVCLSYRAPASLVSCHISEAGHGGSKWNAASAAHEE